MEDLLRQVHGLSDLAAALQGLGVFGMCVLFVVGLKLKWWVWGSDYRDKDAQLTRLQAKVDAWQSVALTSLSTGDQLAQHALKQSGSTS